MQMVPNEIRKQRSQEMITLGKIMTKTFINSQIDKKRPVLFEAEPFNTEMCGFTDNYIKVKVPANQEFVNKVKNVQLTQAIDNNEVKGIVIENCPR